MSRVVLDTVIVAAMLDTHDKWHLPALAIRNALLSAGAEFIIFDIVVSETISVLTRRSHEQRRAAQLSKLLDRLEDDIPLHRLTWISSAIQRLYPNILLLVHEHNGELNFHDALIALTCRELEIPYIASFDRDFDKVTWLIRIDRPENVPRA